MPSARSTLYIALFTTDPTINNTGTEVTGGSYARKSFSVDNDSDGDGVVRNTANINWTNMPACTVTHFAIFDASTAGNPIMYDSLPIPAQFQAGDAYQIDANSLILSEL